MTISTNSNVRFWVFWNGGFVKITLKPGQRLDAASGGPTEEGYSYTSESWEHCGDHVECSAASDGADCDGRHSSYQEYHCRMRDLRRGGDRWDRVESWTRGESRPKLIQVPDWMPGEYRQRDYSAEAMGY